MREEGGVGGIAYYISQAYRIFTMCMKRKKKEDRKGKKETWSIYA
jgi:hypothetical protein